VSDRGDLPIDPDVEAHPGREATAGGSAWPRLRPDIMATVFVGGCVGGLVRYLASTDWLPQSGLFPWSTFAVNIAGAFVLAVLVVVVTDVHHAPTYLRPLIGTGFCGALTTFSAVVVSADRLLAHHHAGMAAAYLGATVFAGLAAAWLGMTVGRSAAASWSRGRSEPRC
jgi:CrcB protein